MRSTCTYDIVVVPISRYACGQLVDLTKKSFGVNTWFLIAWLPRPEIVHRNALHDVSVVCTPLLSYVLQVAEPEGYMDKRKRKGKGEAPKFATADGQALPVKRPRSTPSQGASSSLIMLKPFSDVCLICTCHEMGSRCPS